MLHTIHRFILLIAVQRAASQSAEPSQWDAVIANCSAAAPAGSAHSSITQDSTTTATVAFTGFTPTMMWLANQDGTVVAFSDAVPTTGGTIALTWPASVQGDLPLDLHAHSCPPPATYTLPIRAWRGRYEDVLAMCCATMPPTAAQVTAYSPTITVDWNSQRIRVQAATKAPLLNYAKDSTGMVIRIDETGTGAYAPPLIPFTPLATSVMACALLSADEINPICVETSLVDHIVADLEAGATNPATRADLIAFGANVTYSGSSASPVATYEVTRGGRCVTYARNVSTTNAVAAFSNSSSLSVDLNRMTASMTLYACCGVTLASTSPRIRCPAGALYATTLDVAAAKSTATTEIAARLQHRGAGVLSFSATTGGRCDGFYSVGMAILNSTGQNCTCVAGETQYDPPVWSCGDMPARTMMATGAQLVYLFAALSAAALVGLCACFLMLVCKRRREAKLPGEPSVDSYQVGVQMRGGTS